MTSGIHHIAINVDSVEDAVNFYSKYFSLRQVAKPNDRAGAWLKANDGRQIHLRQETVPEDNGQHLAILVDDIVDSGGTLCNAAKAIMDAGALSVRAYITHGVLSDDACQRVEKSVLAELVVTDSIPNRCPKGCKKTRQVTVSELFGEAIRRVHNEESVSSLFI